MRRLSMLLLLLVFAACGQTQEGGSAPTSATGAQGASPTTAPAQPTANPGAAGQMQWDTMPEMQIDPEKDYTATIVLENGGEIVLKLWPDLAPQTVNNFVFLAREGYYDGITFHRVIPGFMAQGGDPTGTGRGGPGYTIPDEVKPEMVFDRPGLISMAKTAAPDSAGSQFFITTGDASHLNGTFTIFGEVLEGQEVVEQITPRDPQMATEPGDVIQTIRIEESE